MKCAKIPLGEFGQCAARGRYSVLPQGCHLHSNSAAFMQTQSIVDITRLIFRLLKYLDISYEELMVNDDEPVIIGERFTIFIYAAASS